MDNQAESLRSFLQWVVWTVLVPVMCLVLFWGLATLPLRLEHAFALTFGSADLLVGAVLVLGPLVIDIGRVPGAARNSYWFIGNAQFVIPVLTIALLFLFVVLKADAVALANGPKATDPTTIRQLEKYGVASILGAAIALLYA